MAQWLNYRHNNTPQLCGERMPKKAKYILPLVANNNNKVHNALGHYNDDVDAIDTQIYVLSKT